MAALDGNNKRDFARRVIVASRTRPVQQIKDPNANPTVALQCVDLFRRWVALEIATTSRVYCFHKPVWAQSLYLYALKCVH